MKTQTKSNQIQFHSNKECHTIIWKNKKFQQTKTKLIRSDTNFSSKSQQSFKFDHRPTHFFPQVIKTDIKNKATLELKRPTWKKRQQLNSNQSWVPPKRGKETKTHIAIRVEKRQQQVKKSREWKGKKKTNHLIPRNWEKERGVCEGWWQEDAQVKGIYVAGWGCGINTDEGSGERFCWWRVLAQSPWRNWHALWIFYLPPTPFSLPFHFFNEKTINITPNSQLTRNVSVNFFKF